MPTSNGPRKVVHIGLAAAVLLGGSLTASAQRSGWAEESCARAASHVELRRCLELWEVASRNSLTVEEKHSRAYLSKADQTPDEISRALAAFDAASMAFRDYRKKECDYLASLAFGGNGAEDRRLLCKIELDRRRTSNLKSARLAGAK
jgi:uncharacterized protein YecT (DUF1311 family)